MSRVSSPEFIGRDVELRHLERLFTDAAEGRPRAAVIAGEAGVGKSRLLGELTSRIAPAGGRLLVGGAIEFEVSLPYAAFVEALRPAIPGNVARLLADTSTTPDRSRKADATAHWRVFERALSLVGRMGGAAPTILALEDLHWADASTRDLFVFLARNLTTERVVLLATYRDDEVARGHPLATQLTRLERDAHVETLKLRRFRRDEFDRQLAAIRGREVPARLADRIFERSEGNPFFTEELLASEGVSERGEIPATVRDALLERIDRLSADCQRVLHAAAVAGREADASLLSHVLDRSEDAVASALGEAAAKHVLERRHADAPERYVFRHALMQEALYAETPLADRIRLHARVAEALDAMAHAEAARLAFHWLRAQRWPQALAASLTAADRAAAAYAFPEELTHLETALEIWDRATAADRPSEQDRAAVAERAARAATRTGVTQRAAALLEIALRAVDAAEHPVRAGRLNGRLAEQLFYLGATASAEEALIRALDLIPQDAARERIDVLYVARRHRDISERARAVSADLNALVDIAQRAHDSRLEAEAHLIVGSVGYLDHDDRTAEHLRAALAIADSLGDPELITDAIHLLGHDHDGNGRFEDAYRTFMDGAARAADLGLDRSIGLSMRTDAAEALRQLGRFSEAADLIAELMRDEQYRNAVGPGMRRAVPAHVFAVMGRFDEAEAHIKAAGRWFEGIGASGMLGHLYCARAEMAIWRGDWDEARTAVTEALERLRAGDDIRWTGELVMLGLRAESMRASHDRRRGRLQNVAAAVELGSELVRTARTTAARARQIGWSEAEAHLATAEAEWRDLSAQPDPELWRDAATKWSERHQPYPRAYARFREAQALRRSGARRREVQQAASEAIGIAARIGALPLAEAITVFARGNRISLAAGTGAGRVRTGDPWGYGLTRREHQVLELLSEGRTNREIARVLYVTESTAGVHVSSILGKLGVANRVEAAALAVRQRMLEG